MMLLFINKKLSHTLTTLLHFSTSNTKTPKPQNPFIIPYLINSCGLSSNQAIKASKYLAHIKSPLRLDSVNDFFNQAGFDKTQITNIIKVSPSLLCADVDKTLKPKLGILQEVGFSGSEIIELIGKNPSLLRIRDLRTKVGFWRAFLGTHKNLLKGMKVGFLISCNIGKVIVPNILFLRECGMQDDSIVKLVLHSSWTINRRSDEIKDFVKRVDELGIPRSSGMFVYAYLAVSTTSKATFDSKIDLLKRLGWSNEDALAAISKFPYLLKLSMENIRTKIDFLVKEAGCEHSYIMRFPVILSYSLNAALMPRCRVLQILKSEGLLKPNYSLKPIIATNEKAFLSRFVIPNEKRVPKLLEAYTAASKGTDPI